ncbi:MAG: alpha-amylase, partial [Oligoflexus sp.]|nr:alpha-amylase [Pseudopedobacter sp.]
MKKIIYFLLLATSICFSQTTTVPSPALAEGPVTINFDKTGTPLAATTAIYAHIGVTVNGTRWSNVKGTWGTTNAPLLTLVSGTNYKLELTPDLYTYFGVPLTSSITEICVVFRNATGSAQIKPDIFIPVGDFQVTLTSPGVNSTTIVSSGANFLIAASNTNGDADYTLFANGTSINTFTGSSYSFTDTSILVNKSYDLQIKQGNTTFSKKFAVIVNPVIISETIPTGLVDGINYNAGDATKATLVIDAPGKDFVYVAGSFNNWQPGSAYAMKNDATTNSTKFWLELNGLVSGTNYTYQYWVIDETPIAGSPSLVKTADPYSTLVLNKDEDPYIPAGNYPNMPIYPIGQDREVTVLQTGRTPYTWSTATTNFVKPEKDKLVVYELLVRDFDANRSYQNLIDRIDYFKNLKINAIELMPVMEFDGNESWGYNTSFHMALDKAYGTSS